MENHHRSLSFLVMWITCFQESCGLTLYDFNQLNEQYGIVHFLNENLELLHYYGNETVVDEVINYVRGNGGIELSRID